MDISLNFAAVCRLTHLQVKATSFKGSATVMEKRGGFMLSVLKDGSNHYLYPKTEQEVWTILQNEGFPDPKDHLACCQDTMYAGEAGLWRRGEQLLYRGPDAMERQYEAYVTTLNKVAQEVRTTLGTGRGKSTFSRTKLASKMTSLTTRFKQPNDEWFTLKVIPHPTKEQHLAVHWQTSLRVADLALDRRDREECVIHQSLERHGFVVDHWLKGTSYIDCF